jgi:hypothetical protein
MLKREALKPDHSFLATWLLAALFLVVGGDIAVRLCWRPAPAERLHAIETADGNVIFPTSDTAVRSHPLVSGSPTTTYAVKIGATNSQSGPTVIAGDFRCAAGSIYCYHGLVGATLADCGGPGAELHAVGVPSPWRAFVVTPGALISTSDYGITVNASCRVNFALPYEDTPDCVATAIPLDPDGAPDLSLSYRFTTTSITLSTSPGYRYLVTCKAGR